MKRLFWETQKETWLSLVLLILCLNCFIHIIYFHFSRSLGWEKMKNTSASFFLKERQQNPSGWVKCVWPSRTHRWNNTPSNDSRIFWNLLFEIGLGRLLQTWKTLIPGRGSDGGEKSILMPGIRIVESVNRPGKQPVLRPKCPHFLIWCVLYVSSLDFAAAYYICFVAVVRVFYDFGTLPYITSYNIQLLSSHKLKFPVWEFNMQFHGHGRRHVPSPED